MTELTKEQLIEEAKLKIAIAKCHPNSEMARVEGELFKNCSGIAGSSIG